VNCLGRKNVRYLGKSLLFDAIVFTGTQNILLNIYSKGIKYFFCWRKYLFFGASLPFNLKLADFLEKYNKNFVCQSTLAKREKFDSTKSNELWPI